jgi:hypothetical protein
VLVLQPLVLDFEKPTKGRIQPVELFGIVPKVQPLLFLP